MDFNSIFNRAPSGGMQDLDRDPLALAEAWAKFIEEIFPRGRTEYAVEEAKNLNTIWSRRLRYADEHIALSQGIEKQSLILRKYQIQQLLNVLDSFVRSRATPSDFDLEPSQQDVINYFLSAVIAEYRGARALFFRVHNAEKALTTNKVLVTPVERRTPTQTGFFQRESARIASDYDLFNVEEQKAHVQFEGIKAEIKRELPRRYHPLIDQFVRLFVYDPYEVGRLYIRRHHPGLIGAFHGLDDEE